MGRCAVSRDIFIVGVNAEGDAGFIGAFATEAAARFAARHIENPRLCYVDWIDEPHSEGDMS